MISLAVKKEYSQPDSFESATSGAKARIARILLIEDKKSDAVLIQHSLRNALPDGMIEFINAQNMTEALGQLGMMPFDLILLDLGLPDADGSDSVSILHSHVPDIPIVVHTGTWSKGLLEEAILKGASHYWVKGRESSIYFKSMIEQTLAENV